MILEALAIATLGYVSPAAVGARAPSPLPIASHGYIVIALAPSGMADPSSGFREPFDRDYFRWKYRKEIEREARRKQPDEPKPARKKRIRPPQPVERERPDFMPELMARDAIRAEIERLESANRDTERDIALLQAYIAATTATIEADLEAQVASAEWLERERERTIAKLERDVVAARSALLYALERRRRHQNQLAAIEVCIRYYF